MRKNSCVIILIINLLIFIIQVSFAEDVPLNIPYIKSTQGVSKLEAVPYNPETWKWISKADPVTTESKYLIRKDGTLIIDGKHFNTKISFIIGDRKPKRLFTTDMVVISPASPNGKYRLIQATHSNLQGRQAVSGWDIYIVNMRDMKGKISLKNVFNGWDWIMWSPDERYVVIHDVSDLIIVDLNTGNAKRFDLNYLALNKDGIPAYNTDGFFWDVNNIKLYALLDVMKESNKIASYNIIIDAVRNSVKTENLLSKDSK